MSKKTILIVNPSPLYPVEGMNQVRVINQIKSLSVDHNVILMFLYKNETGRLETLNKLVPFCYKVYPLKTFSHSLFLRIANKIFLKKALKYCSIPSEYFTLSNIISSKQIAKKVDSLSYDVLITHYWQSAGFFKFIKKNVGKLAIDTHYAVEENIELFKAGKYDHFASEKMDEELRKELLLQNKFFKISDFLIVNSQRQQYLIKKTFSDLPIRVIPNGQDLSTFLNFDNDNIVLEKNILFYGALSNQFNNRALKRIVYDILPAVRKYFPTIKLIALGSSPPLWLIKESEKQAIEVTGFVDDIRPMLAKSYLTLIPLDSAAGFRGRTVELMAMGVPIIGTHNALDCIGATHDRDMYLLDEDDEIVSIVVTLLNDREKRDEISSNAKQFAMQNYSLDATFGKLSNYLKY